MTSVVGGGSAPGFELATAGWVISGSAGHVDASLRSHDPPIVGRIEADRTMLDFRTVLEGQEPVLCGAIERLVDGGDVGS
jgi:L-seryl-tRNA(Ser) seleniumtransferase